MQCRDFRDLADSFLNDELLVETNHDVIRHLEACPDCGGELAARRGLRSKLRRGFQQSPDLQMNEEFGETLKAHLRDVARRRYGFSVANRTVLVAIAASLLIAAALGLRAVQQRLNSPNSSTAALAESVVGDHRDCALNHRLEEKHIDLDQAGQRYDRAYINLASAVMSEGLPPGIELVEAHSCVFKGRRFGHVILKYHDELVSVLVTNVESQVQSPSTGASELFGSAQVDGYHLIHFETERHAVYVVSGLTETQNLSIAGAIAPSISRHLRAAEQSA